MNFHTYGESPSKSVRIITGQSVLIDPSSRPKGTCLEVESGIARVCLLYTSDAADDLLCVDLGGRRIIKKKSSSFLKSKKLVFLAIAIAIFIIVI